MSEMTELDIKEAIETAKKITGQLTERAKTTFTKIGEAIRKAGASLSGQEQTELGILVASLPKTCRIVELRRAGLLKKQLDVKLRCADAEDTVPVEPIAFITDETTEIA